MSLRLRALATGLLIALAIPGPGSASGGSRGFQDVAVGLLSFERLNSDALRLARRPPRSLQRETDLGCLAVALYHESRGEGRYGQLAVASVIQQRALVLDRWGDRICDVVRPIQFSFMTGLTTFPPILDMKAWIQAVQAATEAILRGPLPELHSADHYHTIHVSPSWARSMHRVGQIGDHIFYRDPDSGS